MPEQRSREVLAVDGLTASTTGVAGRVAGAVLAATRRQVGYTQDRLAERLGCAASTVESWEQGRKPLFNAPVRRVEQVRRVLTAAGAPGELLRTLDVAIRIDGVLDDLATSSVEEHPLALAVPDRAATELLAWPVTGAVPRQLADTGARLDVKPAERAKVVMTLRQAADRATGSGERAAMLRRQVRYLLAGDADSRDWITGPHADAVCAGDMSRWTPEWPLARSTAITAAVAGDPAPLRRFIDRGLASDEGILANLTYWAYWVGELPDLWSADSAMTSTDTRAWSGVRLLETLLAGVVHAPYRDLCAHTLAALLQARRDLTADPARRGAITTAVGHALDLGTLDNTARSKLEQVHYAMEVAA